MNTSKYTVRVAQGIRGTNHLTHDARNLVHHLLFRVEGSKGVTGDFSNTTVDTCNRSTNIHVDVRLVEEVKQFRVIENYEDSLKFGRTNRKRASLCTSNALRHIDIRFFQSIRRCCFQRILLLEGNASLSHRTQSI